MLVLRATHERINTPLEMERWETHMVDRRHELVRYTLLKRPTTRHKWRVEHIWSLYSHERREFRAIALEEVPWPEEIVQALYEKMIDHIPMPAKRMS